MIALAYNRTNAVLHLQLSGIYTTDDLDRFDIIALRFVEANGPVHMLLDFAETTAMAVPASKLSQRGQLPPLCPGHKRVMVMPRRELQEFGWSFREYQRLAGHTAPIVVESLREGLQVLSLRDRKGFEPVSDVASLGG